MHIVNKFGFYIGYEYEYLYNYPIPVAKFTVDCFGNLIKVKVI